MSKPRKVATRGGLTVIFPESLDYALSKRVILVTDETGKRVAGEISLTDEERHWTFVPTTPWVRGKHFLVTPVTIEDLAGNNIGKPFDVDLFEDPQRSPSTSTVKIPIDIR